jgi:hypothetical protein
MERVDQRPVTTRAARAARNARLALTVLLAVALTTPQDASALTRQTGVASAQCAASTGPGIPPPASVPSGIPGFHASWFGQSGYPTLCPGQRTTATVAFYNSGSRGWVLGRAGETAFLGIPDPAPSGLPPDPSWPAADRVAIQPATYVGPNQVAWFQFSVTAPSTPGKYRLYIRPVIEGTEWMEDEGVFWELNVVNQRSDAVAVIPTTAVTATLGTERAYTAVSSDGSCLDLALVAEGDVRGDGTVVDVAGHARLSSGGTVALSGATSSVTTVACAPVGSDHLLRFTIRGTAPGELRPVAFRDLDGDHALDVATEPYGLGGPYRSLPPDASRGPNLVTVGMINLEEHFIIDTQGSAVYRYDPSDHFERNSVSFTVAWFQLLVSRGDVLNVSYEPDPGASSTFTFINDVGRETPTARGVLDNWDGGSTQNDIGITLTEPTTNIDGIAYLLERAVAFFGTICDGSSGAYNAIAQVVVESGDEAFYLDRDLPAGAYCYRVGIADLLTAVTSYAYTTRVNVPNPPAPVARPRSTDARLTQNGGSLAGLDAGDAFKIAFDKRMGNPATATLRFVDVDGTTAEVRCGAEAACTLSTVAETLGGFLYETGTVITIAVVTVPRALTAGSVPSVGAPATIVFGDLRDFAGNLWDVPGSADLVVGAPD